MKALIVFLLALFCTTTSFSQSLASRFLKLSGPEKRWVIFHPFVAKKAFRCTKTVQKLTDSVAASGTIKDVSTGGPLDALRHALWMAVLAEELGHRRAAKLGKAHEKGNRKQFRKGLKEDGVRPDSLSCVMDLLNNQAGIVLAQKLDESASGFVKSVFIELREGRLWVLLKDESNRFLDCDGKRVDDSLYRQKWFVPRCLVRSGKL